MKKFRLPRNIKRFLFAVLQAILYAVYGIVFCLVNYWILNDANGLTPKEILSDITMVLRFAAAIVISAFMIVGYMWFILFPLHFKYAYGD